MEDEEKKPRYKHPVEFRTDYKKLTLKELQKMLKKIDEAAMKEKNKAMALYAQAHNPKKLWDLATDEKGTILIFRMSLAVFDGIPQMMYEGWVMWKNGTQRTAKKRVIYQQNLIK